MTQPPRPPIPVADRSRRCRWCRHLVYMVETEDGRVLELDMDVHAWNLTTRESAAGLTIATAAQAWPVHDCLARGR